MTKCTELTLPYNARGRNLDSDVEENEYRSARYQ